MPPIPSRFRPLRALLQEVLGGAYRVERELGGGGMSRVFVAEEVALGRRVVVKVLPPELAAGLNAERFRREIQLAAALQHPHIVPLHAAGAGAPGTDGAGVMYFTMPFIEGESLRARLARAGDGAAGGGLPVEEAIQVLREIADALAHAHARGVVHRDVKPDNVLMSGGHAVVTDFGVAAAVDTAGGEPGAVGAGLAIGTPAYMAPEQATGSLAVDHRADLYALGALAYELLAGRPPFAGRTAEELMTAHVVSAPKPLGALRPEVPAPLARLVARCLAKDPDARPASAAEVRDALQAMTTAGGGLAPVRRAAGRGTVARRAAWLVGAAAAAAAVVWAGVGTLRLQGRAAPDEGLVAVAPFRVDGGDASVRWLREGMIDLLAATLTGEGGPRSADPRALLSAWRRAAGSDTADLPRAAALEVAERVGAGLLLLGEVAARDGDSVSIGAALVRVRDGRAGPPARVTGAADSLPQLVDRLAATLLAAQAGEGERARSLAATPLPALRAYLAGQSLYRRSRFRESAREFERAIALDSGFALAGVGLAGAAGWFGDPTQLQRGLAVAWSGRDRLSPRDRALFEARGGPRFPLPPAQGEIARAKLRYARVAPERPEAWFEAGDALFHFGALLGEPNAAARAAEAFERALSLDSTYAPALEHLVMLAARAGDTVAVRRWAALFLAVDSAGENADGVRWRAAVATNDRRALDDLARRGGALSAVAAHTVGEISQLDGVGLDGASRIMAAHTRSPSRHLTAAERQAYAVKSHDLALNRGHPRRALALTDSMRAAGVPELAVLQTRLVDAVFGDGDTVAAAAAARALAPRAYAATPARLPDRLTQEYALCAVEMWRVSRGDTATARRSVARLREPFRGPLPPGLVSPTRPAYGCALMLEAALAAESRHPGAPERRTAERLDSLMREGPNGLAQLGGNLVAARLHERLGDVPAALAAVRRREYFYGRTAFLSTFLREEARLAERAGDLRGAAEAQRHYAALRAGAEPGLQDIAPRGVVDVDPTDRGRSDQ